MPDYPQFDAGTPPALVAGANAEDVDRMKDTERILALFNPELRNIASRVPVRTVGSLPYLGYYNFAPQGGPYGSIDLRSDVGPRYEEVLREELLHSANFAYEPFAADARDNFAGLARALTATYGGIPQNYRADPAHTFTSLADIALTNPRITPLDIYRYFLPLRQGVLTD